MAEMSKAQVNEPAMDPEQAQADRHGYMTTVEMVTGKGRLAMLGDGAGPEVGNAYDEDPLGEEFANITFRGKKGA